MTLSISYAVMTHNEDREFDRLMTGLSPHLRPVDEVVVVDDFSDQAMLEALRRWRVRWEQRKLSGNFAAQRNFLGSLCRGDYIFMIDADEYLAEPLMRALATIVEQMQAMGAGACELPRYNRVIAVEQQDYVDPDMTTRRMVEIGHDPQIRIYRNDPRLSWYRPVHEKLRGYRTLAVLPVDIDYALIHIKTERKLQGGGELYRSISWFHNSRTKKFVIGLLKRYGVKPLLQRLRIRRRRLNPTRTTA